MEIPKDLLAWMWEHSSVHQNAITPYWQTCLTVPQGTLFIEIGNIVEKMPDVIKVATRAREQENACLFELLSTL